MIVALDLEHRGHAAADVYRTRVLAGSLQHGFSRLRKPAEMHARALVAAVLGPHDREHAELLERRHAAEMAENVAVLVGRKAMLDGQRLVHLAHRRRCRHACLRSFVLVSHACTDRNSTTASSEPRSGSTACSGCGIRPTTLPASLETPAMSQSEPLGAPSA